MFAELSNNSARGAGHYGYAYEPQSPPPKRFFSRMGPFSQLHSRHKQVHTSLSIFLYSAVDHLYLFIFGGAQVVVGLVVVFLFVGVLLYFNPAVLTDGTGASPHSRGLKDSPLEAHLRYPLQQVRLP